MDVVIDELIIEKDRPAHIAKHEIEVGEVLEIVFGNFVYIRSRENCWLLVGKTKKSRFLTIVIGERNERVKYVKKGTMKPSKPFKSLEEEANFWDTHSVLDEIDEGTLVGFHRANKTDTITIRFQPEHIQVLKEQAFQMGIGPTTLARMWIMEKLQKDSGKRSKI